MAGRARLSYRTAGDCLSHLIPAATFRQLLADSPPVAAWFNEGLATKGRLSSGSGRGEAAELMVIRVGEADLAPPARVDETTSITQARAPPHEPTGARLTASPRATRRRAVRQRARK